ncbi:MFS transporter [Alkalicoccobacillus murimartini]|uniref:MFS family permease n=1 Tax=Alkalicoccobacillus murimartini TaxID=171685 RepID=A0ABT9YCW2_9BACI|nr:MFS transporter [Alkalicoccobacillus murimartini]MDQ0205366.1 MFS family permease [Alkalicoccobacillus murimartini]
MIQGSALKNRNVLAYFLGTILFKLGDKVYLIAIPWLIYELTQSAATMGIMFLVQTLPLIFISPIAGMLADRLSRKKIMIVSAGIQGCLVLFIPLLHYFDWLEIGFIYVLGFLIASAGACFNVTNGTVIPQLFERNQLMRINSFFQFIDTSSVLFGSMIAGILISQFGIYPVFIIVGVTYFPIILSLLLLQFLKEKQAGAIKTTSWHSLWEGAIYLWNHKVLRSLTILIFVVNVANGALVSMLVFFSRDQLRLTSTEIGWVYAGAAIAQIAGIVLVNMIGKRKHPINLMVINLFISALGIIGIAFSLNWFTLMLCVAIQSAPVIMFNVLNKTYRQQIVPTHILGRVNGMMMMISLASLPLAGFLTGILSELINIRYIFLTLAVASLLAVVRFRALGKTEPEILTERKIMSP